MGVLSLGPAWLPRLARSKCCQGRLHQGKFNNHIGLSSMNVVLQLSRGKAKDVPPGREGYCLMWSVLGCAAGQDMIFWSRSLNMVRSPLCYIIFYARFPQPGMVSTIDIQFRFSVQSWVRVSNSQRHPTPKHWSKDSVLCPPPPERRRAQG